jgi:pseudouridine synthase
MSTTIDPEDRPTVMVYVATIKARLYPVGRLDWGSEGLLILTNDGEFTKSMTKAGVIPKVYHVKLAGKPDPKELAKLRKGIYLDGERLAPCEIEPLKEGENPWYVVTLHQGRNQQIRRMFSVSGHPVEKLRRVKIGFLEDKNLKTGGWRFLTEEEVQRFKHDFRKRAS